MSIEPVTITISGWVFVVAIIVCAAHLTLSVMFLLECLDKPKRKKRH